MRLPHIPIYFDAPVVPSDLMEVASRRSAYFEWGMDAADSLALYLRVPSVSVQISS